MTAGTQGYARFTELFIESSQSLIFHDVCKDFINFLPEKSAHILDIGAGAGQHSAAIAKLGHKVTAIEPMPQFLKAAKNSYRNLNINWLSDSLPELSCLISDNSTFDFVLIDAVWHHLNEDERFMAVNNLSKIINREGKCAISLRNGPAGMGSRVFPTSARHTIELFQNIGFKCIFKIDNQPSIYLHKKKVVWSRIVLEKD